MKSKISIRMDDFNIEKIKAEFPTISIGINKIISDWISRNCPNVKDKNKEKIEAIKEILKDAK